MLKKFEHRDIKKKSDEYVMMFLENVKKEKEKGNIVAAAHWYQYTKTRFEENKQRMTEEVRNKVSTELEELKNEIDEWEMGEREDWSGDLAA